MHTGYIIMNTNGDVLIGIQPTGHAEFMNPALMDDLNKTAVVLKDQYCLPPHIKKHIDSLHMLLQVTLKEGETRADAETVSEGKPIGSVTILSAPTMGAVKHDQNWLYGK